MTGIMLFFSTSFYEYTGSMDLSYIAIVAHDHGANFALFRPLLYKYAVPPLILLDLYIHCHTNRMPTIRPPSPSGFFTIPFLFGRIFASAPLAITEKVI